jgi:glycosyltransferase involved in cell wall biosynthesis
LVEENQIGIVFDEHNPMQMAEIVKDALYNEIRYQMWKKNLVIVTEKYNWEKESERLREFYKNLK